MLKVGKFYMCRGGNLLRYVGESMHNGVYVPDSTAFKNANGINVLIAPSDVIRELAKDDLPMLATRRAQAEARNLKNEVEAVDLIVAEIRNY